MSRPNTDGHPDLDGRTYASLDRLSKLNLVKFLKDHYSPFFEKNYIQKQQNKVQSELTKIYSTHSLDKNQKATLQHVRELRSELDVLKSNKRNFKNWMPHISYT